MGSKSARRLARSSTPKSAVRDDPWKWADRSFVKDHPDAPEGLQHAYLNAIYSVQVFNETGLDGKLITHLMVRRHDGKPIRNWADCQRIKDDICGHDRVAVEVYPASVDLVDQANIYHLWVFPAGIKLPFGLHLERDGDGQCLPPICPRCNRRPISTSLGLCAWCDNTQGETPDV